MKVLHGISASPGYALGTARIYRPPTLAAAAPHMISADDATREQARLEKALAQSIDQLAAVKKQVLADLGEGEAAIFDAHLCLLEDEDFHQGMLTRIADDHANAELALSQEVTRLEQLLASLESVYFRERSADFRDIGNRVLRNLRQGTENPFRELAPNAIIIANALTPSDTVMLDLEHVIGIATEVGGDTSHAAILSRSRGIPAVTAVPSLLEQIGDDMRVLVDGERGLVTFNPTERQSKRFRSRKRSYERTMRQALATEDRDCRTSDGTRVLLYANVNRGSGIDGANEHNLDGVGLFRTEFLFGRSRKAPNVSAQTRAYAAAAGKIAPHPLTVRTFDLGGDKRPEFLYQHDASPYLRLRGLRFSLKEKRLLRTQMRAILRAHREYGNVRMLFPMVISRECVRHAMEVLHHIAEQEDMAETDLPPVGAMIETPAAIFGLDGIIDLVDFISVGTNDLSQYMLAADRMALDAVTTNSVLTPAMLAALKHIAEQCRRRRCPVCICGEAGGEVGLAGVLVGLGFRELSMSPVRAPSIRLALSKLELTMMQDLADAVLQAKEESEIQRLVKEQMPQSLVAL